MIDQLTTTGYRAITSFVRDTYTGDKWAHNIGHMTALADVMYVWTGLVMTGYRPKGTVELADDLSELALTSHDYDVRTYCDMARDGEITPDDVETAFDVMYRLDEWYRRDGLNY